MNDNIQVVLFIKGGTLYNPKKIANKIQDKIPELGTPLHLPLNKEEYSAPLLIYKENRQINFSASLNTISVLYEEENERKNKGIILEIMDIFESEDITFDRIGYISTKGHTLKEVKNIKNKLFKDPEVLESSDFQIGWYNPISLNGTKANCWQRYFPDVEVEKLISVFDINTPKDDNYNITRDFVETFINDANRYVESKIKI